MKKMTWLFGLLALLLGAFLVAGCAASSSSSSSKPAVDDDDDDNDDMSPSADDDDNDDTVFGACCSASGSCGVKPYADCQGNWMGPNTDCVPNPCPDDDDNDDNDNDDNDNDDNDNNDNDNDDNDNDDNDNDDNDNDDDASPTDDDDDSTCDANTCASGCCDGATCEPGTARTDCGSAGNACEQCSSGYDCVGGACQQTVWTDPNTGLMWQMTAPDTYYDLAGATNYCSTLALGGYNTGWTLPDIDDLRTLISGCDATAPGGPCLVSDACSSQDSSCDPNACNGCLGDLPAACGYVSALGGSCGWTWSATAVSNDAGSSWGVGFSMGDGGCDDDTTGPCWDYVTSLSNDYPESLVRCVNNPAE